MDITIEGERGLIAVQTDHRNADEMSEQPHISTVFAVTRVLNPMRAEGDEFEGVKLVGMHPLADFLAHVVRCAGARVEVEGQAELPPTPDDEETDRLFNIAMEDLAKEVVEKRGLNFNADALSELQREFYGEASEGPEGDEILYWESAVRLASVVAEVIRREHGGKWVRDPGWYSTLPYVFSLVETSENIINVFGKVEKYFGRGSIDEPTQLLQMAADSGSESGPFLPNLRPADWALAERVLAERMIEGSDEVPWVAYGNDHPQTFAYKIFDGEDKPASVEESRRPAIDNLRAIQVERVEVSDDPLVIGLTGSYFAAEKLLDERYVKALAEELGSDMLVAGMPEKGVAYVSPMHDPSAVGGFVNFVRVAYDEAEPAGRLSPHAYFLQDGKISGLIKVSFDSSSKAAPAQKEKAREPGLLRRVFSKLFG
jgi:hypothetical protein